MNKSEIIKKFLEKGYQLDPSALDLLMEKDYVDELLPRLTEIKSPVITAEHIRSLVAEPLKVLKLMKPKPVKCTVDDVAKVLNTRYQQLKRMLETKELVDLVSINKVTPQSREFSVIGMVSEACQEYVQVEDPTGELKIFLDSSLRDVHQFFPNEVVAIKCRKSKEGIYAEEVIWPDIPLRREVRRATSPIKCLFISDFHMDSPNFNREAYEKFVKWISTVEHVYTFVLGDVSSKESNEFFHLLPSPKIHVMGEIDVMPKGDVKVFDSPVMLELGGLKLLLMHGQILEEYLKNFKSPQRTILALLQARHLNPTFVGSKDPYLLDEVPDIVVAGHVHEASMTNYRTTTVLTTGSFLTEPIYWLVDLSTREVERISFSH
jgi:DNA polymerase II small subunit